jgi:hypothetical protein
MAKNPKVQVRRKPVAESKNIKMNNFIEAIEFDVFPISGPPPPFSKDQALAA